MARNQLGTLRSLVVAGIVLAMFVAGAPAARSTGSPDVDPNPPWPARCGIDVALLVDHSNSIKRDSASNPTTLKNAAKSFAGALEGTPSRVAVHSFWKTAEQEIGFTTTNAAGVTAIGSAIDAIPFSTDDPNGSTNWDEGFRSVAPIGAEVVVILTDGNPTVHLSNYGSGGSTEQADINEGVTSANRTKGTAADSVATRIVAVGIGGSVSVANLKLISGPDANDDYFTAAFADLGTKLGEIAARLCGGTVVVQKQAQEADGTYAPASGWGFSGSLAGSTPPAIVTNPENGVTDAAGEVNLHWSSPSSQTVTVTESVKPGFALASVVCTKGGQAFPSDAVANGAKLTVGPSDVVRCVFKNERTDPSISVVKTVTGSPASVGDTLAYGYEVTNTGNLHLTNVKVTDDKLGAVTLDSTSLAPGGSASGTKSYTVKLSDLPGPLVNIATAVGTPPSGPDVTDTDDATVTFTTAPAISIVKTGASKGHPGEIVTYTFTVTNTGDVPLSGIAVTDDKLGAIGTIPSLAAGAHTELTKSAPAPSDDVTNVGKACGTDPLDTQVCDTDDHDLDVIHPAIELVKTGKAQAHEGDEVTYTFTVENIGDVALTDVTVNDDPLGPIGVIASLAPGAEAALTHTVAAPADDLTNVGRACGSDPLDEQVCDTDDHVLDIVHPALALDKKVNGADHATAGDALVVREGDTLDYSVVITNTGDTPLKLANVIESLLDDIVGRCGINLAHLLAPNGTVTCAWTSTASADESGEASADGADELDPARTVWASDVTFVDVIHPALVVGKSGPAKAHEGDEVTYAFVVTNAGDVALTDVDVSDDKLGAIGTIDELAPGASETFERTFTVPVDVEDVTNIVTVCGFDPLEDELCDDDTHTSDVIHPAIRIVKTADEPAGGPRTVTFSYEVTNTGDTPLAPVVVTDDILGDVGTIDELAAGESETLTKAFAADVESPTRNIGTAVGTDELGRTVSDDDAEDIAVVLGLSETPPPVAGIPLPRTGADVLRLLLWAGALVLSGIAAMQLARRRRPT